MQRYKAIVSYDGTDYVGFQRQLNGKSIQEELEKALYKMTKGMSIGVVASGRTDSGVHATGQVIHFDYPAILPIQRMQKALNSLLPEDIRIGSVEIISSLFHARYHTCGKQYMYHVSLGEYQSPFKKRYALHHPYRVNIDKMKQALQDVLGEHDFTSFCSTKTDKENKIRCVTKADIVYKEEEQELIFIFEGNGFLYNMVRILVGTTLQIGDGLKPVTELKRLLTVKNRQEAGPTAAPHGLYLTSVFYKPENQWFQTYEENKGMMAVDTTN
ncbi:tRNA pseudouridine(38-40) synthase TruA [Granulicatella sp. zg-ZJ]|uniref:tRNA pseudouridine(38-40) synthase TruA n=1 Tax=Granulicatella sp. zg-ZJ TaxID=2678504 RepID=UPI0013D69C55|nr:tRNA pseudouridine(38-40) synthase TruA [Granulicatella sp. zg-ZJ]NEW61934.1 tRNA pseudouridine(38-40) synthase TruA [Granulicatella sp. zg-ZJ]